MLLLGNLFATCLVAYIQLRQRRANCLALIIATLFIDRDETGKTHALMGTAEDMAGAFGVNGHRVENSICHLGCQKTAPDQLVKPILILGQSTADTFGIQLHMGGADGFVGILRIGLCLEHMELAVVIFLAVAPLDKISGSSHRLVGKTQRVGTHIGNQTRGTFTGHVHTFIQLLGNRHGLLGCKAQLAGCLLLQGGSGKRRRSRTLLFRLLYIGYGKELTGNVIDNRLRLSFTFQFPLLVLAPVTGNKGTGLFQQIQLYIQRPVFLRLESADLIFPIHHQSGSDGLHAACGQTAADFLPQQRGQLIAHDAVEDASCLLGIHQIIIDLTGMRDGFFDYLLGDLVKCHTPGFGIRQIQQFFQMPGNGLTLTVRVGCEIDGLRGSRSCLQFLDQVFLSLDRDIAGRKISLQIHTHGGFRQIPQMSHTCLDGIIGTQIFSNGLRLGGRLHNYKIGRFAHAMFSVPHDFPIISGRCACPDAALRFL